MEGEFSQCRLALGVHFTVVLVFFLDGCEVVDRGVQPVVVEPVHPGQRGQFELIGGAERAIDLYAFGLVKSDNALCESIDAPIVVNSLFRRS